MNPLVKKEIRLLLPSFGVCCALALGNFFFRLNDGSPQYLWWFVLAYVFAGAMAVMLALNSFGEEISSGTFSSLLAQPVPRQKIWDTKILLLAAALSIVGIFWCACGIVRLKMIGHDPDLLDLFAGVGTFGLAVFSGGLWTVLLLRQVAAAFWFTVLVPGVISMVLSGLFADYSGEFQEGMLVSVLGLYSLAGFFFARWLFFRAQDFQWSGGSIVMPEMRGLARFKPAIARRAWRPRAALWRKEIQLHQAQFVMAFSLLILHLGVLVTRKVGHFQKNSDTEFILEIFWGLWLVMPLLVGCAAVAEERKLGTQSAQLCLPVKQRSQFAIKFLVVLGLSIFFGAVMPLLLEGTRILPKAPHFDWNGAHQSWLNGISTVQLYFWFLLGMLNNALPALLLVGIATLIGLVSLYASSLTRNTLQALAPAVLGLLLAAFLVMLCARIGEFNFDFLWRGPLPFFTAAPILVLTLVLLAAKNSRRIAIDWKLGAWNIFALVFALAIGVGATSATYHRVWEKLTPFEPAHGAAKLSLSNPAGLDAQWNSEVSVHLSGGKFWLASWIFNPAGENPFGMILGNFKVALANGAFLSSSNWLAVKRTARDLAGIKTDGTLWVSENPSPRNLNGRYIFDGRQLRQLVQFGSESNWSSLAPFGLSALLVKNDGTLWQWGTNFDLRHAKWPGLRKCIPQRLGTGSNWAEVFPNYYQIRLRQTDGSIWVQADNWNTDDKPVLQLNPDFAVVQSIALSAVGKFRSTAQIYHGKSYKIGVRDDGTFRILADERLVQKNGHGDYEWFPADLQIGDETNWLAVAGEGDKIVTLKNDGTLWLWDFHLKHQGWDPAWDAEKFEPEILKTIPVRLGTHSDWIAISGNYDDATALAADGSLWFWPLGDADNYFSHNDNDDPVFPLLDISRKPRLLANIFGKAD